MMAAMKNAIIRTARRLMGYDVVIVEPTVDQAEQLLKTAQVMLKEAHDVVNVAAKKAKAIGLDSDAQELEDRCDQLAKAIATIFVVAPMRRACRIGIHKWTKWSPRGVVVRRAEEHYTLSESNAAYSTFLTSECLGCGAIRHHEQKGIQFKS